jgi:hypothetical protein
MALVCLASHTRLLARRAIFESQISRRQRVCRVDRRADHKNRGYQSKK